MDDPVARKMPNSDEGNGRSAPKQPIDIVIRFDPVTQNVEVSGPTDQRVLFYGMLEMARTMVDDMYLKADLGEAQPRILPASGPLPPFRKP